MTNTNNIKLPNYAFIDGKPYDNSDKKMIITSPIDKSEITTLPLLTDSEVDMAVAIAKRAFDSGVWSNITKRERANIMFKFADLIDENKEYLATLETLSMGMPINMCINKNIIACSEAIRWYGEAIDKTYDESTNDGGKLSIINKEPVGVVGVITPWNFPSMIVGWKIGPALAMGNSVILKPAESSSLATIAIAELASQAGIPDGVFNVITGSGRFTGKALALHNDVRVLAFTGSGVVGGQLLKYAGESNLKRIYLELGGKNANIILPDVPNIDKAVMNSVQAIFANSGQICASPSRLLVHNDIYDEFVKKCINVAKKLTVGNPFENTSNLGPVANEKQYETILSFIKKGKEEGATCVLGGDVPDIKGGYYINPTIFTNVNENMSIAKEEIFGPVLSIISFSDIDEAIRIANNSEYGLTAGIWTKNINTALKVSSALESGTVFVNHFGGAEITLPFGGIKESGNGVDKSLHALDKYSQIKTTIIQIEE